MQLPMSFIDTMLDGGEYNEDQTQTIGPVCWSCQACYLQIPNKMLLALVDDLKLMEYIHYLMKCSYCVARRNHHFKIHPVDEV